MQQIDQATIDRVIQMAWEDRTSFDAIQRQFGLDESAVIRLMRSTMKRSSFNMWRAQVEWALINERPLVLGIWE